MVLIKNFFLFSVWFLFFFVIYNVLNVYMLNSTMSYYLVCFIIPVLSRFVVLLYLEKPIYSS